MKNESHHSLAFLFFGLLLLSFNSHAGIWGCKAAKATANETTTGCFKVNKQKREYRLQLPSKQQLNSSPLALIIGLHGGGGKAKRFQDYAGFEIQTMPFIAVYPQGIKKHWSDGRANINGHIDDVIFIKQLVKHLKEKLLLPINLNQIYIAGMSNGGLMTLRMACEQPKWLAGVAVVAATMTHELETLCQKKLPLKPLKIAFVFGEKDTSFLSNGKQVNPLNQKQQRGTHIGINNSVQFWKSINQCSKQNKQTLLNKDPRDKTKIIKNQYQNCLQKVVYFEVKNGGHRWPSPKSSNGKFLVKRLNVGLASQDMNAGSEILRFFLND